MGKRDAAPNAFFDPDRLSLFAIPSAHRPQEDREHVREQIPVIREPVADLNRQGEYPLAHRNVRRKHVIHEPGRRIRHSPARAARAEPSSLAAIPHCHALAAVFAAHPHEAVCQHTAPHVIPKLVLYVSRQPKFLCPRPVQKGLQMLHQHPVQENLLRLPPLVLASIVFVGAFHTPLIGRLTKRLPKIVTV